MLVLDESLSIGSADVTRTRQAADAFVNGLRDTGTQLGIIAFAVGARNLVSYQEVTAATLPTFRNAIENNFVSQSPNRTGTNWDHAFRLVPSGSPTCMEGRG
jgi:hypothetical protein